jgi:hypothetical protein
MWARIIKWYVLSLLFEYSKVISPFRAQYWSKLLKCVPTPGLMQNLKYFSPTISVDFIIPVKPIKFIYACFKCYA